MLDKRSFVIAICSSP